MFNYPKVIKEETTEIGRTYYFNESKGLPSVTTVISHADKQMQNILTEWKLRVGEDEANRIVKRSLKIGTIMHDLLEHHLKGLEYDVPKTKFYKIANKMATNIINNFIDPNLKFIGSEVPVYVPDLYAGRIDCIGYYNGVLSIVDFKNSYKDKKEEYLDNYKIQCAAYAIAHDTLFGTEINQCVILIGNSTEYTAKEFVCKGHEFTKYKERWLKYLDIYYGDQN